MNKKKNGPTRYGALQLKSLSEIKQIYASNSRQFDLERFQRRFLQMIRRWTELALPVPELARLKYGSITNDDDSVDEGNVARKPMATLSDKENNMLKTEAEIDHSPSSLGMAKVVTKQKQRMQQNGGDRKPPPEPENEPTFENHGDDVHDDIESSSADEEEDEREEEEEKIDAKDNLERKRKNFMKGVKDPLQDIIAKAQSARTHKKAKKSESEEDDASSSGDFSGKKVKTPSFRKTNKKSYQLKFDSSESEDSEGEGVKLSEVPARYSYEPPARSGHTPREIPVGPKAGKMRTRFTQEEDAAIVSGIEQFGVGRWAEIKAYYSMQLRNRTSVQIKDRWRNIEKKRSES